MCRKKKENMYEREGDIGWDLIDGGVSKGVVWMGGDRVGGSVG